MKNRIVFQLSAIAKTHNSIRRILKHKNGRLICTLCGGGYMDMSAGWAQCNRCGALLALNHTQDGKLATIEDVLNTIADMDTSELPTITG